MSRNTELAQRLRVQCESLRRKPTQLADLIPLMQQAADALSTASPLPEGVKELTDEQIHALAVLLVAATQSGRPAQSLRSATELLRAINGIGPFRTVLAASSPPQGSAEPPSALGQGWLDHAMWLAVQFAAAHGEWLRCADKDQDACYAARQKTIKDLRNQLAMALPAASEGSGTPKDGVPGAPAPDAMQALKAALPVLQDYASSNPMHFYRGAWHDPRGVHAAVKLVTAALGVLGTSNDQPEKTRCT